MDESKGTMSKPDAAAQQSSTHRQRGEEDLLQQVDGAWNTVAVQTAWKLEPAYMYEDKDKDTAAQQRRDS